MFPHQPLNFTLEQWLGTAIMFPILTVLFYRGIYNEPQAQVHDATSDAAAAMMKNR
ncbi:uncharacterized protein FIESC28_02983 [Fusarium coffeatum]|uniref:Uncharacterized protein n=1 Tax=Fusarium coffeatum TaxID=231269 RepID=A0A366S6E7_9HYPO|nr:uncharacterized protein FIESC28_02983 [Fusarium coffeatum]RBR24250.1 hypothetical protein FIESC28_02983 [Fusarium coffeatum]